MQKLIIAEVKVQQRITSEENQHLLKSMIETKDLQQQNVISHYVTFVLMHLFKKINTAQPIF